MGGLTFRHIRVLEKVFVEIAGCRSTKNSQLHVVMLPYINNGKVINHYEILIDVMNKILICQLPYNQSRIASFAPKYQRKVNVPNMTS